MPRLNKKATQAKQQRIKSRTNFISTPENIDSDSIYSLSSDEASDDSSSDESVDATKRLFSKKLPSHLQPQLVCHLNWLYGEAPRSGMPQHVRHNNDSMLLPQSVALYGRVFVSVLFPVLGCAIHSSVPGRGSTHSRLLSLSKNTNIITRLDSPLIW